MKPIVEKIQKLGLNSIAILTSDVMTRASTLVLYMLIGRYGDKDHFGQLSLGLMLLYTFHVFAVAGLPTLLVRKVARAPQRARSIWYHGYVAAIFPACLSLGAMASFTWFMSYSWSTTVVVLLLALALIPYAAGVIAESVIRGSQSMLWIVLGNFPGTLFLLAGSYGVIMTSASVIQLAGVVVGSRVISMIAMHLCCSSVLNKRRRTRIHLSYAWMLLKESLVFFWSDAISAISASLNTILLSKFAGVREVGWLTACFQLLQPMLMVYRSVGNSCFPMLVQNVNRQQGGIAEICQTLIVLLVRLAIPATVVLFAVGGDILVVVYGKEEFRAATPMLQILAFTLLLDTLNPVIGNGLWAAGKDKLVLNIVVVNFVASTTLSAILVSQYGILGAAWSIVLASVVNVIQHYVYFQMFVGQMYLFRELIKLIPILSISGVALALPAPIYIQLVLALVVYGAMSLWILRPFVANLSLKSILRRDSEQIISS